MTEVKKKRGRPRKNPLPTEITDLIKEVENKLSENKLVQKEEVKEKPVISQSFNWDIPLGLEITFFDKKLSYEISGYKPIDETRGLEFNPEWFTEARETFLRTGHYCQYLRNSKAYSKFWDGEYEKCMNGLTVNGYTITGDHYFFLNYYQLMDLTSTKKSGTGRAYAFPRFFVAQYEYFHYIELCKRLRMNAVLMKARGVGFSEMDAASAANTYNSLQNSVTVIAAQQEIYVSKTLSKVWKALSFLNDFTDGGFFKLSQVKNTDLLKKASFYKYVDGQKVEDGWMSLIQGIVADKPNKIRGDRTDLLIYEEAGSWPSLTKAFIQGDALVGIQGQLFGIKVAGGTGGDSGPALEGLRDMYYDPDTYGVLPFKHNFTATGEEALTGFFIPSFSVVNTPECMDNRGFTSEEAGKSFYNKERGKKSKNPKALVVYCAEYCYNAEEAFSLEGDNKFNKANIATLLTTIRALKQCPPIDRGYLEYLYKNNDHSELNITGFKWIPNLNSNIQILEHPIWTLEPKKDENGKVIWTPPSDKVKNLYVIGVDGIDIGKAQTSEATKDPSDWCLVVYKRAYGLQEPQPVALYKDRPNDIREAYKITIKLAQYYNAQINIEATRLSIIPYAKGRKLLNLFMRRPRATLTDLMRNTNKQFGTPATPAIIDHQTDLIADYINDYCHLIWFDEMLDEFNRYTDENKRKFDIVVAFAMALLADEELQGIVPKNVQIEANKWLDIGFYTDEQGFKRYGVIPTTDNLILFNNNFGLLYDDNRIRTSNPRIYSGYL